MLFRGTAQRWKAPFMVQDGCAFIHTKQRFCWHQAQAWPEKLNGWMTCREMYFLYTVQRWVHQYSVAWREWAGVDPIPWHAMHLQPWNPPKVNRAHSTSIFMSYLHLHDLCTTLSESCIPFQTNRRALSHRNGVCDGELQPTPHLSKCGQHWPLSGSLSQYAPSYETGKHMWCCMCVCVCA